MIYCSGEWKREIKKIGKRLKKHRYMKMFIIERDIFISAFIVRKLIESDKMSDYIDKYKMDVVAYLPIKHIDKLHCYIEENYYDWSNGINMKIELKKICNYLIHSYIFNFLFAKNRKLEKFFVSSDYDRNKYLYEIKMQDWLTALSEVSEDRVIGHNMRFQQKADDYISSEKIREE